MMFISRIFRVNELVVRFCLSWIISFAVVTVIWGLSRLLPHDARQQLFPAIVDWIFDYLKLEKFARFGNEVGFHDSASAIKDRVEYTLVFVSSLLLVIPIRRTEFVKTKSEEIFGALFAEPDLSFLTPIRQPKAFDPLRGVFGEGKYQVSPLKWIPGSDTSRSAAFEKILEFARKDGKGRQGKGTFVPFKMLLIVGPLSCGKSRLAMEAARKLARRDVWGGDAADKKKFEIARVRLRSLRPNAYRQDDPWDAWWLAGPSAFADEEQDGEAETGPYTSWEHRKQMREDPWLDKLKAWRPRRPTIFLLDDPLPGDAQAVANALHANEALYRHPVRLLVVSPMPPDRLENKNSAIPKARTIILSGDDLFTEGDIRVAGGILGNDRNPLWKNEAVAHLYSITKGNPLLVEIALDILRRGRAEGRVPSVTDLTRERLLIDRVERWREALRSKGVSEKQEHALAAATLAAGAKQSQLRRFLGKDASIDKNIIRELFPGAKAENKGFEIPPLRPIMIGDAFVRNVIVEHCDKERQGTRLSEADKVLAAAWNANPLGMIASIERLSIIDDVLGRLITQDPIADLKVAIKGEGFDAEIARAWALTAMRVSRGEWDAGNKTGHERTMLVALGMIDKLSPAGAAASLQDFVDSIPASNESWIVRSRDASRLIEAWVEKALLDGPSWRGAKAFEKVFALDCSWWHLIDVWGLDFWEAPTSDTKDLETREIGLRKAYQRAVDTPTSQKEVRQFLPRIFEFADDINGNRAPFHAAATLHGFTLLAERAGDKIMGQRFWIQANAYGRNRDACKEAIADFEQMTARFPADERVQLERAKAFRSLAYVHSIFYDIDETQTATAQVEAIADKFACKPEFELERALSLNSQLYSYSVPDASVSMDKTKRILDKQEELYNSFSNDYRFVRIFAGALRCYAWYDCVIGNTEALRSTVTRINDVVMPFVSEKEPISHRIVFDLVETLNYLVGDYSRRDGQNGCWEALQYLERISNPFAGDCTIERSRVDAWQYYCNLYSLDKVSAVKAFDIVESIAAPFSGDPAIELHRARAGAALAWKLSGDLGACASFVNRVAKIADTFKGKLDFEVERASAYAALSWGDGNDLAARASQAWNEIKLVAEQFPANCEIHENLATALSVMAFAAQRAGELEVCRDAVNKLDDIARRFPGSKDILWRQAEGWKCLAYAARADSAQYGEALCKLKQIANRAGNGPRWLDILAEAERYISSTAGTGPAIRIGDAKAIFNFGGGCSFNPSKLP